MKIAALALLGGLMAGNLSQSDPVATWKQQFEFSTWPGKSGELKAGFLFTVDDFKLKTYKVEKDGVSIVSVAARPTALRRLLLSRNKEKHFLEIEIQVAPDSTDDAQEALLLRLGDFQAGDPAKAYTRGSALGLEIGDISFIGGEVTKKDVQKAGQIDFVRNNIRIRLRETGQDPTSVVRLARDIDEKIRELPDQNPAQVGAMKPIISSFVPLNATVKVNSTVPLKLEASDPRGQALRFLFESTAGGVSRDETVNPPTTTFFSDHQKGAIGITVSVIDASLLFRQESTSVEVLP
jgi:hypothetical protein